MSTQSKLFLFLLAAASPVWAVPKLRVSNTVVGPLVIAQGSSPQAEDIEAFSVGERGINAETQNLRLSVSSTAPWVTAQVLTLRNCAGREGQCAPVRMTFSTQQLQAGSYTATVTVSDPAAIDAPQRILVVLNVGTRVPERVSLIVPPGGTDSVAFFTKTAVTRNLTTQTGGDWLALTLDSASTFTASLPLRLAMPAAATFDAVKSYFITGRHLQNMAEGTYNGSIQLAGSSFAGDNRTIPVTMQVTSNPIAAATRSALRFRLAQNTTKLTDRVFITNRGRGRLTVSGATATTTGGGSWLKATKLEGFDVVDIEVDAANVQPGVYKGNVAVASNGVNATLDIPVELEALLQGAPSIRFEGVQEIAAYEPGDVLAAGGLVAAFGEQFNFGSPSVTPGVPWPTELGGVRVFVNDQPAPIHYSSYGQVNFQIPYNVPRGEAKVRIDRGSTRGNEVSVTIVPALPKIMRIKLRDSGINLPESRDYFGIAVHQDGTLSLPRDLGIPGTRPTRRGEAITLYTLGFGQTTPPVTAGQAAPSNPLARVSSATQQVLFGALALNTGVAQDALFIGLTPGLVGLYQVNVIVPNDSPVGDVPVRIQLDAVASEYALISVE